MIKANIKWKNNKRFLKALKEKPLKFFTRVRDLWKLDDQDTLGEIVKEQLTGRPGLNRQSGQAARALNVKVRMTGRGLRKDVESRLFINASNQAKEYLPFHDKSRKHDGIIKAKNSPYLHFKMHTSDRIRGKTGKVLKRAVKQYSWVKVKQVQIPARTNILEYFVKDGSAPRRKSVRLAMKEMAA